MSIGVGTCMHMVQVTGVNDGPYLIFDCSDGNTINIVVKGVDLALKAFTTSLTISTPVTTETKLFAFYKNDAGFYIELIADESNGEYK